MKNDERANEFFLGVIVGSFIGGVTALLLAPTSGKKLRRKISNKAEDLYEDAQEKYEAGKDKAEELYKEGKKRVSSVVEDAKKIVMS
jgi:gas vesicle protein